MQMKFASLKITNNGFDNLYVLVNNFRIITDGFNEEDL